MQVANICRMNISAVLIYVFFYELFILLTRIDRLIV